MAKKSPATGGDAAQESLISGAEEPIRFKKTVRLAVTGDVQLTDLELRVTDTPDFQRLRGIKQLGLAHLVFPSAVHTRFEHSLGAVAIADQMMRAIRENQSSHGKYEVRERDIQLARLFALLHDITHVPYGHTLEDELRLLKRHDENPERIYRLLGPQSVIGQVLTGGGGLGRTLYRQFLTIYLWDDDADVRAKRANSDEWVALRDFLTDVPPENVYIHDVVSNTLCADLLDYIARDSFFCNVDLSFDYRFIKYLYLDEIEQSGAGHKSVPRVHVSLSKEGVQQKPRRDTLTDLTRLLEVRYMLTERVYFHPAKLVAAAMVGRALQEHNAVKKGELSQGDLSEVSLLGHSDDSVLRALNDGPSRLANELASRVRNRQLYKIIASFGTTEFAPASEDHSRNPKDEMLRTLSDPEYRRDLENKWATLVGLSAGDVLLYAPSDRMNMKLAEMRVFWRGESTKFCEIDDAVVVPRLKATLDAHRTLWRVALLAPPGITDAQKASLSGLFRIEFLTHPSQATAQRRSFYKGWIEEYLKDQAAKIPPNAREYHDLIDQVVEEHLTVARGDRRAASEVEQLELRIKRVFGFE